MHIAKVWFKDLPSTVEGPVVVIDAYAASANMSILLSKNPNKLIVVNELTLPRARELYPKGILCGESTTIPASEFKYSNKLVAMNGAEVTGEEVLWMSDNGSRVFEEVFKKTNEPIVACSFNNAQAVVDFFSGSTNTITLIMAGNRKRDSVEEDRLCAELLENRWMGTSFDWQAMRSQVAAFVLEYYQDPLTPKEIPLLLDTLDTYSIVPKCSKNDDGFLQIVQA